MTKPPNQTNFKYSNIRPKSQNSSVRQMFKAKIGDAPANSVELRLFHGHKDTISTTEIERRLDYLTNQGKRTVKVPYRAIALTFLMEELSKRTQDPIQSAYNVLSQPLQSPSLID